MTCEIAFWGKNVSELEFINMYFSSKVCINIHFQNTSFLCIHRYKNFHIKAETELALEVLLNWKALLFWDNFMLKTHMDATCDLAVRRLCKWG